MIDTISASYLLAFGIFLIGIEALTFTFVLFFIGIGFVVVSIVSYFYMFSNGTIQIAIAFVLALFLAFTLRKILMKKLAKADNRPEERAHRKGVGVIEKGAVKFDGTYWKTLDDITAHKDGDKVEIIDVINNMVVLKK